MSEVKDFCSNVCILSRGQEGVELDLKFGAYSGIGYKDFNTIAKLTHNERKASEFSSTAIINSITMLDLLFKCTGGDKNSDVISNYVIPYLSDFYSTVKLCMKKHELPSSIYVANEHLFQSYVRIKDYLDMDFIYESIQSPDNVETIDCVKDTYVYSYRPTLNYGSRLSLMAGNLVNGKTVTYMYFPLDKVFKVLNNEMWLVDASLKLTFPDDKERTLKFTLINDSWDEYSITWRTKLSLSDYTFSDTSTGSVANVYIADLLQNLYDKGITSFNVMIECEDECIIYSRESEYTPQIVFNWRDPVWAGYASECNEVCTAIIRAYDNRDLVSIASIVNSFMVTSSAIIHKLENDIASQAYLRGFYNSGVNSTAEISSRKQDLQSEAKIAVSRTCSISSTAYNPTAPLQSTFWNRIQNNLSSFVSVKGEEFNDMQAHATVVSFGVESIATLVYSLAMGATAQLVAKTGSNLSSLAVFQKVRKDLWSEVVIPEGASFNSLESFAKIQGDNFFSYASILNKSILEGSAFIRLPYTNGLSSTVKITQATPEAFDLSSTAGLKGSFSENLHSVAIVESLKTNLSGESVIRQHNQLDINSEGILTYTLLNDFPGQVDLKLVRDFNSVVELFSLNNFGGSAVIQQFDVAEVDSTALISAGSVFYRLFSTARIRQKTSENLDCVVNIKSDARQWIPNVHAPAIFKYGRKLPRQYRNLI